jgi:3-oxoadipate enol-lactonase
MPFFSHASFDLYYEIDGEGFPLICISGLGGSIASWVFQKPVFSKYFKMISFDNRGAGKTLLHHDGSFNLEDMADDVALLMDHLSIDKAHILGFSMGGRIAQHFALRHPHRVAKLALGATAATIRHTSRYLFYTLNDLSNKGLSYEMRQKLLLPWMFSEKFFSDSKKVTAYLQKRLENISDEEPSLEKQVHAIYKADEFVDISKITCPTYLIVGEEDLVTPVYLMKYIHEKIKNSTLEVIAGAHCIHVENAKVFNEKILAFLLGA